MKSLKKKEKKRLQKRSREDLCNRGRPDGWAGVQIWTLQLPLKVTKPQSERTNRTDWWYPTTPTETGAGLTNAEAPGERGGGQQREGRAWGEISPTKPDHQRSRLLRDSLVTHYFLGPVKRDAKLFSAKIVEPPRCSGWGQLSTSFTPSIC